MVTTAYFAIAIALGLLAWVLWSTFRSGRSTRSGGGALSAADSYELHERAKMPMELRDAKLVISEKTFFRRDNRPFAAKTDQAFLTRDGKLVLVESKSRRYTSESDLVQISAQAVAIASDKNGRKYWGKIAPYGYIRLAPAGGTPYYLRVLLMHPSRIDQLWDRWNALKNGARPIRRPDPNRCKSCVKRSACPEADLSKV